MLRITIAQINPTIGDMDGNIELMRKAMACAAEAGQRLVVFPELSLTSYYPADLLDDADFQQRLDASLVKLEQMTRAYPTLYCVVGAPTRHRGVGKAYHNSLQVLRGGEIQKAYHKQLLPTYNVFDERRHFEPGPDVACVLSIDGVRVGFLICEDGWNDDAQDYAVNPFARLAEAAPDLIVSINGSPSSVGHRERRHQIMTKACTHYNIPLLYVNQVGGHDQLIYDGGSFAVEPSRGVVFEAQRFKEQIVMLAFSNTEQRFSLPEPSPEAYKPEGLSNPEFYRQQIVLGLRDYARRCGFIRVVVGSSGGIDSALTLALAVEALGPENVTAITMPSEFSSAGSVADSEDLCKNLGIKLLNHPIQATVDAYKAQFELTTGAPLQGLALENLQARVRGTILMEYSNSHGHLLLTTGNKSELSTGFCTLYGDTNGGLALIADLYKLEIFALCRYLNELAGWALIPWAIIDKPPSAELSPGQLDTDSLPPYPVLDEILKLLIEGVRLAPLEFQTAQATVTELLSHPEGAAVVTRVKRLISLSEYKRRQSAPILRLRARAFGTGRQVPIAARHY